MELFASRGEIGRSATVVDPKDSQAPLQIAGQQGILIAAPPMRVLYADLTAHILLLHTHAPRERGKPGTVPRAMDPPLDAVKQICTEIFQHLRERAPLDAHHLVETRRLLYTSAYSLRVRGFGMLGKGGTTRAILLCDQIRMLAGERKKKTLKHL